MGSSNGLSGLGEDLLTTSHSEDTVDWEINRGMIRDGVVR